VVNFSQKEEDITISFKPKVMLVKGNTVSQVRLVLAEFEGPDADYIKLDSSPHRAFIGAYWTSKTKELALILGDDVPAHTSVTIVIPASSGVRRVMKKELPVKEDTQTVKAETLTSSRASHEAPSRNIADIVKASEQSSSVPVAAEDMPSQAPMEELTPQAPVEELTGPAHVPMTETTGAIQSLVPEPEPEPEPEEKERQYGIDIELEWSEAQDSFVVKETVRGGAAWKNGLINVGNVVTHIDEEPLAGKTAEAVSRLMLGEPSTPVVLTVRDFVDPLSGQVQTRDVKVMRYDTVEMTIDFYDEEQFCDIPEVEEEKEAVISQAEWARRQLAQGPKEHTKMVDMNDISKKVSDQSKAAKDRLQTRSEITKTAYDAEAVSQQARWAKDQLENRKENTQKTLFDAEMVAEQTRAAMESLANLPQKEVEKKFDATSVAEQAKWAKQQLENRPDTTQATSVDTASVSEQAQWAKKRLLAKEKGQDVGEEHTVEQNTRVAAEMIKTVPAQSEAAPSDDGINTLDALCRLAGIDDLPGMDEVLGTKSPDKPLIAEAPAVLAPAAAAPPPPAPVPPAPVAAALPVATPAAPEQANAADSEAEKKRRAMQKRLEFLAMAEANKSANSSTDTTVQPAQVEAPANAAAAQEQPAIILAPSPVESGSNGPSPTAKQPAPSSLFTAPAAPPAPARTASKPLQQVMSHRQSAGPVDLNGSSLPPPTKNFVDASRRQSDANVEEQMQFIDALSQSPGHA
jgi:hypothetical protein